MRRRGKSTSSSVGDMCGIVRLMEDGDIVACSDKWNAIDQRSADTAYRVASAEREFVKKGTTLAHAAAKAFGLFVAASSDGPRDKIRSEAVITMRPGSVRKESAAVAARRRSATHNGANSTST